MGAIVKKSLMCLCFLMLALVLGFFGCGDIYKNMKISVDTSEIVLYLNGGEGEPSSQEIKATISGIKDKKVSKEVTVVFDDEKIASAGNISYSGNDAYVTIYASAPGTTNMRVKSLDNSKRVSSESIKVTVVEKVESIDVSNVVASAAVGSLVDLSMLPGIVYNPSITSETDLEFYFLNASGTGTDTNVFGRIVDKHLFDVSQTAPEGFCDIIVKSTKLKDFDSNSPLQKQFTILVYDEIESDDITLSKFSKKDAKYVEVKDDLVMMSNYVDTTGLHPGSVASIDEKVLVALNKTIGNGLKNYVSFDIVENSDTQKGVVKIDKNISDVLNEFKVTPNQTGRTSLSLVAKIEKDGKTYIVRERKVDFVVKTIVTKMEVTTSEQDITYELGVEPTEKVAVGVFEKTNYKGSLGTEIKAMTSPREVVNPNYKILLGDGKTAVDGTILRKDFENYISISDGEKLVKYGEEGGEFQSGSKFYISYEPTLLADPVAKELSEFSLFLVSNYEDGLKRIEAEVVCYVYTSLKNLAFDEEAEVVLSENNKDLEIKFSATNNINPNLIRFVYDVEVLNFGGIVYDRNEATINLTTKKLGSTTIKVVEKYTSNEIVLNVLVVVPTDDVYLTVNKYQNDEIGDVVDYISDGKPKTGIVKLQSGASFYININTTNSDATLQNNVSFEFNDESAIIRRETVFADFTNNTIVVSTSRENYSEDINDSSTFALMAIGIGYYAVEDGKVVERTVVQEIRVGAYKKLVEFSFGNRKETKHVEIYDQNHLSINNKAKENIGYSLVIPYFETPVGSSYSYYLDRISFPNGDINTDIWHIDYIGYDENPGEILMSEFHGIKISATGADALSEESREIVVHFSIREFRKIYSLNCTVKVVMPTPEVEDIGIEDNSLYMENWQSAYNRAEIKTSVTPLNVFDQNLSYVIYSVRSGITQILGAYDRVGLELVCRYFGSSVVNVEIENGRVYARSNGVPNDGEEYFVAVIPSYLLNFDNVSSSIYRENVKNVIDEKLVAFDAIGVCKAFAVNIANGTEAKPYQIANLIDLKTMLRNSTVNQTGTYFVLSNTILFDEANYQREDGEKFTLNAIIKAGEGDTITGITAPLFDVIESNNSVASISGVSLYYEGHEAYVGAESFAILAIENRGIINDVSLNPMHNGGMTGQILITQQEGKDLFVGGLVAKNYGQIINCFGETNISVSVVSAENNVVVGGFVAVNESEGVIKAQKIAETQNTYSFNSNIHIGGEATENSFVGGLAGINYNIIDGSPVRTPSINNLTNINVFTEISAENCDNIGGIAGRNDDVIRGVLVSSKIEGHNNIGGAVGSNNSQKFDGSSVYGKGLTYVFSEFFNNREIDKTSIYGNENVGGLVGRDENGSMDGCYVTTYVTGLNVDVEEGFKGDIYALNNVGGLVGKAENTLIIRCFANTSIGLGSYSGGVCGGLVGFYNVTSDNAAITKSYALNNFGTIVNEIHNGLKDNKFGQLVGVLKMSLAEEIISTCYAVTNGGVLSYSIANSVMGYRAIVNTEIGSESVSVINNENADVCGYCFYADADAVSSNGNHVSIKSIAEMQNIATYTGYGTNWRPEDWRVNETANGGFPLIVVSLSGYSFELYNAQVGSINITSYNSDDYFITNNLALPRFVRYEDGKTIVILEMLCSKNESGEIVWSNLTLADIISLSAEDLSLIEVKAQNDDGTISVVVNDRKTDASRFELLFNKTGVVKLSVQSRKNSAVSKTFQICVVGGFKNVEFSNAHDARLYVSKGGSNRSIVNYTQDAETSYNDRQQIQLKLVESWGSEADEASEEPESEATANVTVGGEAFVDGKINKIDVTTNKTLLFTGVNDPGRVSKIELIPYLTVSFYNAHGNLESIDLLLKKGMPPIITADSIATSIDFNSLKTVVFEGVNSINLNEESATLQSSGKLDVEVLINSDAIDLIADTVTSEMQITVIKSVFDETQNDFVETKEYKAELKCDTNPKQMILSEKVGEAYEERESYNIAQQFEGKDMIISFSREHEKVRMAQKEKETWQFSFRNQDGSIKSATLNIVWEPASIENIGVLHYINSEEYQDGKFEELGADEATNRIASGSRGVLKIQVTQNYSDYDYIVVKGTSNVGEIVNFTRLMACEKVSGDKVEHKLVGDGEMYSLNQMDGSIILYNLFGKYKNEAGEYIDKITENGKTYYNTQSGIYYVSTLITAGLDENTEFNIDVYAYKITDNGDELVYSTEERNETTTLYSAFAPYIYLSVADDFAKTTDGGLLARGTELTINVTGVLQQSTVDISLSGYEINTSDNLTKCSVIWNEPESGVKSSLTSSNFSGKLVVYAGINSLANNKEGKLKLTAVVSSPGFSTTTSINLYLVDYLISKLGLENVDETEYGDVYNIKIQDGYKPLKLKLSTGFGDFFITSGKDTNLQEAIKMSGLIGDAEIARFKTFYESIVEKIVNKLRELNALGTTAGRDSSTIWRYKNANLNISSSTYDYFYLGVDNKYQNNNVVTIRGKEEVDVLLSTSLHRGVKLNQNGNLYELIVQPSSITESYLGVSSGDYNYAFTVHFINSSSDDLPSPVTNEQELREMAPGGHYILTKDITVTNWVPLTTQIGSLDGNGYKIIIKNFNIGTTNDNGSPKTNLNAGLFESISTYYDTKTESTQPTRLTNIVLDVSQTIVVDLGNATGVNFGFLVGQNSGGVVYNCEVVSGASENRAKLNIDSDVDVDLVAGQTKVYSPIGGTYQQTTIKKFSEYIRLYGLKFDPHNTTDVVSDSNLELTYAYRIVGRQGDNIVLDNDEVIDLFADDIDSYGYVKGKIYSNREGAEVLINGASPSKPVVLDSYTDGNYFAYKKIQLVYADKEAYNNFVKNYYNYARHIAITGYQNNKFVLENGEIIDIINGDSSLGFTLKKVYSYDFEAKGFVATDLGDSISEEDLEKYSKGNYYVYKESKVEITDKNLSMFNYEAWQNLYETEKARITSIYGSFAQKAFAQIDKTKDTTSVFIISGATIQNSATVNIGGLVGNNDGYISNSRIGRLADIITSESNSKGRNGVDEDSDGIVDSLMQEYGLSIFGCGRLGGLASVNSGVISGCYFANSNLVNMHEITNNQYIITGGLVAFNNNGKINSCYVESNKQEIKFDIMQETFGEYSYGNFTLNGLEYIYKLQTGGEAGIYEKDKSEMIASVMAGKFVLGGVEYSLITQQKQNAASGVEEGIINSVRRTQNNIFFSGEIGGLVHTNIGEIQNSYANIGLKSTLSVGGFVYNNMTASSTIKYSYSTCAIDNENIINGPFVGTSKANDVYNQGTIVDCYYLIDSVIKQNANDPAASIDAENLCSSHDLLQGFVISSSNQKGLWELDESLEFETPRIIEADKIAYSRREDVVVGDEHTYNNTNFGVEENPKIVYSPESFRNIKVDSNYNILDYVRVVANVDFQENSPKIVYKNTSTNGEVEKLSSVFTLTETSFQGNGMTFDNLNIVADDNSYSNYLGLFKKIDQASFANINLIVSACNGAMTNYVGAIAGLVKNASVHNVTVSAKTSGVFIKGRHIVGGAIGEVYGTTSKVSNVECSISVNSGFDAVSVDDYKFISENINQTETGIENIQAVSYAGGVVGAVVVGGALNRYNNPAVVNCSVKNDFVIQAIIAGGVVGYVSNNSAISECTLTLNSSEENQEIQSDKIAGGLVGENRGLILYSYISLEKEVQRESDLRLSEDRQFKQKGTDSLFTGSNNILGGLVGLNIGSLSTQDSEYAGAIRYSYSRVKVINENALVAGGLVGAAIPNVAEYGSVADILDVVQPTRMYYYRKTSTESDESFIDNSGSTPTMEQSLFLHGVYATGIVKAKNAAGGLVGVATAFISTMESDTTYPSVVALPDSVSATQADEEGLLYNGIVIGKANYRAEKVLSDAQSTRVNVFFSQNGCISSAAGVSTISLDSSSNLIGGVENSKLYKGNYYSFTNDNNEEVTYHNMFDVINSVYNMQIVFSYMRYFSGSGYAFDTTQNTHIFPELANGLQVVSNTITSVKSYLLAVKSGEIGNYKISSDIVFDFGEGEGVEKIDLYDNHDERTAAYWFERLYGNLGPSGDIVGFAQSTGQNITITIKNNTRGIPFFGGSVSGLNVTNINFNFVVENGDNVAVSPENTEGSYTNDIYWGALARNADSCILSNVNVDFNSTPIIADNYLAVGGLFGKSSNNRFNGLSVTGFNLKSDETNFYTLRKYSENYNAYFGAATGRSSGDIFDKGLDVIDQTFIIKTKANQFSGFTEMPNSSVYVGGITGFADGNFFRVNQIKEKYFKFVRQTITLEATNVGTLYVGGVVGYVRTDNVNNISNTIVSGLTMNVKAKEVFAGGFAGRVSNTLFQNCEVSENDSGSVLTPSSIIVSANLEQSDSENKALFVGGVVGHASSVVNNSGTSLQINGSFEQNKVDVNIDVKITDNSTDDSDNSVGGIAGYFLLDDSSVDYGSVSAVEVALIDLNQTKGEITVEAQRNKRVYVAGLFGRLLANQLGDNKIAASRLSNNAIICVSDVQRAVIGGICADCMVNLTTTANYGSLTNGFTPNPDNPIELSGSYSAIGGIAAKTTQNISTCLSLGAIFEPNFVEEVVTINGLTSVNKKSFAEAIVCCDENSQPTIFDSSCYYSSDFTGVLQITGNISSGMNMNADTILHADLIITGFERTYIEEDKYTLIHIRNLNVPIYAHKKVFSQIGSLNNGGIYVIDKSSVSDETFNVGSSLQLNENAYFSLIGNDCFAKTTGCALFDVIPARVLVSGITVLIEQDINGKTVTTTTISTDTGLEDDEHNKIADEDNSFGLVAKVNNGTITNCMAGTLPKQGQIVDKTFTTLTNGLSSKTPGVSESGITTIDITGQSNAVVGGLVGVNNKMITNCVSYVDINVNTENACIVSNLVGKNNFRVNFSIALGKLNVNTTVNEKSYIGEVIGRTKNPSENYSSQLFGYVDVKCGEIGKVGAVVGGNNSANNKMFYIPELSRSPACFIADANVNAYNSNQIYNDELTSSNINSVFWTHDPGHLYGYYCLNINKNKLITYNNSKYEIENYAEFNMLNYEYMQKEYVFVRDLVVTTKLLNGEHISNYLDNNSKLIIDGDGHYLFADGLINSGLNGGYVYSAFNMNLNAESEMRNVIFKFGETNISSVDSLQIINISPLIKVINGGTVENCAVVGDIIVKENVNNVSAKASGSFGGLCSKIQNGGELSSSWSGVSLKINKVRDFTIGGLCAEMNAGVESTTKMDKCFVDATIEVGDDVLGSNYVGGLVGSLVGGTINDGENTINRTQISYCYVSKNSQILTAQFNNDNATQMYIGEFGGSVNFNGASNKELLVHSIYEGFFIDAIGDYQRYISSNYYQGIKPKDIAFGNTEQNQKRINSSLGFGKYEGFTGVDGGVDRAIFNTAISTYKNVGCDLAPTGDSDHSFMTLVYVGGSDGRYNGALASNGLLDEGHEAFTYDENMDSIPYLTNVTPSDRTGINL